MTVLAPEACGCPFPPPGPSISNSPICNGFLLFMSILEPFLNGRCAISNPCHRVTGTEVVEDRYDFVVVGAGTAGSIVAARLAENPNFNVLLIDAGGIDPVASRAPAFYRNFWNNPEVDWMYRTEPGDYCLNQGRKGCVYVRGKGFGGSSIHNGMAFHRGHRADFDEWQVHGAPDWGFDQLVPYFRKFEDNRQIGKYDPAYHATGGPMPISQHKYQEPFVFELLKAANESGYPLIRDMNDPRTPDGFTLAQTFSDGSQRYTTARAYIENRHNHSNLTNNLHVLLSSHVTKVLIDGDRAKGVEYLHHGVRRNVTANKEVILSAGALNTPQLLMLSGIGPSDILQHFDIPQVANLPVGRNLRNHVGATLNFILEKEYNYQTLDWAAASKFLLEGTGPMTASGIIQVLGFTYSKFANRSRGQPDIEYFFNGFFAECSSTGAVGEPVGSCAQQGRNISINAVGLRPRSTGYVTLRSKDPLSPPLFYPNYFDDPYDVALVKDAVLKFKAIVESETLQSYGIKWNPSYDACAQAALWSEPWLECVLRVYTDPQNHQAGTAAIGSVVDQELRVYGVGGLRVIDASVMPLTPTGNPQGVIMMVAERGAAFIRSHWSRSVDYPTRYYKTTQ